MSSKGLCYLSGIDWSFYTLDHLSKKATGCGNASQVVLCLEAPLDVDRLRLRLEEFVRFFPQVHGSCARAWNLAPYWRYSLSVSKSIPVISKTVVTEAEALAFCYASVNTPFSGEEEHLRFLHISSRTRTYVSIVFDHRLFDAHGAQTFLHLFHKFYIGERSLSEPFVLERSAHLSRWREKFEAGRRVNRHLIDIAEGAQGCALKAPQDLNGRGFVFRTISFDRKESDQITERAYATAGYLMMAPYFLSVSMAIFKDIFGPRLSAGNSFLIPVNTDIRPRNSGLAELFFNHLSFFFLRFSVSDISLSPEFIKQVSARMYDAMSGGFAKDLAQASLLLRIVPRRWLDKVNTALMRLRGLTFSFSYVNKGYEGRDFCGSRVLGVVHTPRVAVTPGVGVFFTQFDGCLSLTFSFLEGLASEADADVFMREMHKALIEGSRG